MPSNFLDDFLQGVDPMDAATLFAGIRNSVPLSMLFRSGDTNAGHDEELAKRQGPRMILAPPPIDPAESIRRAQTDFEMQYPDPRIRQLLIDEMLKQARDPYSPTTATRRRDFEEVPMSARHYMSATPEKKKFAKGGGVKKTLDEIMAEMAQKGVRVADKPDLARRTFFGLGAKPAFPLANLDAKALEKMQSELKGAPAITEKTVTVDPGKGAAKSTLKSLSETPMSRREVLQSAAGQVMRGALPDLGGLGAMGNVAKAVESAAPVALPSTAQGLMALALKKGMNVDEAIDFVRIMSTRGGKPEPYDIESIGQHMKAPHTMEVEGEYLPSSEVLRQMMRHDGEGSIQSLRGPLREIKQIDPDRYEEMLRTARDISRYGFED